MKKTLLTALLLPGLFIKLSSQCLTLACPSPVTVNNDPGICGAVVNYNAPVATSTCANSVSDTFFYSGAMQTYVVPAGVTTVTIQAWGAQGGANWVNNVNFGGYSKADFPVTPGETLYIFVGQQPTTITGGFNGGGNGEGAGQGGGGGSDVRQAGTTLNNRIIVGGGGGGAGYWSSLHVVGGVGGGMTGGDGYRDPSYSSNPGGLGGTQTGGGATGTCVSLYNAACAGGFGNGGAPSGCGCEGYGGGGGWYGGAGSGNCRGGGGGSGYILPTAANPTMTAGIRVGNGMVVIAYNANTSVPTVTQNSGLASGSTFPVGVTTNSFTASDAFGNTATCSFQVTVSDNEAPVISSCPLDITMCPGMVTFGTPTATDNCSSATVSQTSGPASGSNLTAGTYTVTFTATDAATNSSNCNFTITVNANPTVTLNLGPLNFACLSSAPFTLGGENPSGGTWSGPGVSGNTFDPSVAGVGFQPIVYTYTDVNGCSASANDTIDVDLCTGITNEGIRVFRMYPNPASNSFSFISKTTGTLELLDANGKLIKSEKIISTKQEINLSGIANGTYVARFISDKGDISTGQLVIQK